MKESVVVNTNTGHTGEAPDTIVLIHGLWMTPRSWELWKAHYEKKGFNVLVPAWPGMEGEVEVLNADPSPIASLTIEEIVGAYTGLLASMEKQPIIMGHSLGGTVLQLLVDHGLSAAAVGVAPGTVKGVPDLPLSTLRSTFPVLHNPRNRGKAVPLNEKQFHYAFANTLTEAESHDIYRRYHVPCASEVLFEAAFASLHRHSPTEVDFGRDDRAPMLLIGFEHDHIVPASAIRHNAEKYTSTVAVTEFKEFPNRPHFPGVPGWEEVADYALGWALVQAGRRAPLLASA